MVRNLRLGCKGQEQGKDVSPSPLLFNIILDILANVTNKEMKDTDLKGRNKLSLFADNMIVYKQNLKDQQKHPETNKNYNKSLIVAREWGKESDEQAEHRGLLRQ